ncbi:MAG: nuclear transport factor 2 family protein [Gemmatimonadales bacterium]|jgi:uncharacterized protein (TIGR02246 family)
MRRSHLLLTLASVVVVGCSTELSVRARAEVEQAVQAQMDIWVRAMNNMDLDSLLALHNPVPELTVIWADGTVAHGWDEEKELHEQAFQGVDRVNFGVQNVEIQVLSRDIALVIFRHSTDVILADGERGTPTAGFVSMVWTEDPADGEWKILMEHHSVRPPAGSSDSGS